ncbi:MAG: gamma-glutamyltransferase [Alteromonadaceae bacterium]|uniref:gamma-glutamyltransferase n=1 Tax=Paraglaciecola chathamensis TaxID=368405 RepID=UPI000C41FB4B|nr:gamma-glutamyltransferase [Paraglaciecola agarilytica]MBN27430.1 gamma-glutamyltransferase [Alteromonadaceae bacterium]|tara:strand:- start:14344 stop:16092 length:1749 start_codon:yes stop_codon:yes gene_type:complete
MKFHLFAIGVLSTSILGCSSAEKQAAPIAEQPKHQAMVVTANPHATAAGLEVLRAGGSAVDAAIAIESVLSLVEPQSSGLAGGAFMVHYDNESKSLAVYDGRETAPSGATPDMFMLENGDSMPFIQAKTSGLSTGVPGIVAMLSMAHQDQGTLEWNGLFDYAHKLATDGFEISPRLHGMLERFGKYIPSTPEQGPTDAHEYFFDEEGQPHPTGYVLKNPEYAKTLEIIANNPKDFYQGDIAKQIAAMVQQQPRAGSLTAEDIAAYKPVKRAALCQDYRDTQICGAPPPSSWLAVGMIMGILENGPRPSAAGPDDPKNWAIMAQAQQLAYADRDQFVADPNFVDMPINGMLNKEYLAKRATLISDKATPETYAVGDPWAYNDVPSEETAGIDATRDVHGTTHFVVVDTKGDVVSMTATVESIFGTTRMVGGMFLNNQLTDFSFQHHDKNGNAIVNAVAPNKRPRSSMSPSIVLDKDGAFLLATGSPGGNNIIAYTVKTMVGVFEWGLAPQAAVDLPNMVARGKTVRLEKGLTPDSLISAMQEMGFDVDASKGENSGLSVIMRKPDGSLEGAADKRREGVIGSL